MALAYAARRPDVAPATFIADALARIGAQPSDFQWPTLVLARGEQRVIATAADGLARRTLITHERAQLDAWLGVDARVDANAGSFEVDVVTANIIVLPARSRLILAGRPVIFVANEIQFAGGRFVSTVDGHYTIGVVHHARRSA